MNVKKHFKDIIIIIIIVFVAVAGFIYEYKTHNTKDEQTFEEPKPLTLSDYPELKLIVEDLLERLKKSSYFDSLQFVEIKENKDKEIEIEYDIDGTTLSVTYLDNQLIKIWLRYSTYDTSEHIKFDYSKFINQQFAIIYLEEFDINENDFDNRNELYTYENFINVISGVGKNKWALTTEEKGLMINYDLDINEYKYSFIIIK